MLESDKKLLSKCRGEMKMEAVQDLIPPVPASSGEGYKQPTKLNTPQQSVLAWVYNIGEQKKNYNGEQKIQTQVMFGWELNEEVEPGVPFLHTERFNFIWSDRSNLTKSVSQLLGRSFSKEELEKPFSLGTLIGVNALLTLTANTVGDRTYINTSVRSPLIEGMPKKDIINSIPPDWVVNLKDRGLEDQESNTPAPAGTFD